MLHFSHELASVCTYLAGMLNGGLERSDYNKHVHKRARTSRSMAWICRAVHARFTRMLMKPGPAMAGDTTFSASAPPFTFTRARSTAMMLSAGSCSSSFSRTAAASALGLLGAPSCVSHSAQN